MNQSLLKSSNKRDIYDPFESPPDLLKAQDHRKATMLGKDKQNEEDDRLCPCCEGVIEKYELPLGCEDEQLLFLGVGYPLFYKLARYFGLIIVLIFMISGSGYYFLVTLNCTKQCVYFFGIPIINLEISGSESAHKTDIINVITAFAIFGCSMYIKYKINGESVILEKKFISPAQYTVIVQNLPENVNDEDIIEWSKQAFQEKPVLINFAYNVSQLSNAFKNRQKLTIKLNKMLIERDQDRSFGGSQNGMHMEANVQQIKQQIKRLDSLINLYRQQKVNCHKIGTAFLTFSQQKTASQIVSKYENSLLKIVMNKLLSPFRTQLTFRGSNIIINEAPGPREVIWQNLSYSFLRSVIAQVLFVITMVIVLYFSFRFQYKIVDLAYSLRHESKQTKQTFVVVQALAVSLIVVLVNSLLRLLIKLFAYFKRYYSYSSYHSSFCFYYSMSYIFNTCFMIYIVYGHRDFGNQHTLDGQQSILVYDIHLLMLANAFSEPLFKVFDPQMWFRLIRKRYIQQLNRDRNPYTQSYVNNAWQGYQIQIADNYQYIFRILIVTTWFAHSAPFGVVISLLGLFVDYWIGKYLLLRHYKRPQVISNKIARPLLLSLQLLPLVYICGLLQFTYKVSDSQNIFTFLYQFLRYGMTVVVILICLLGYILIYRPKQQPFKALKYDEIQSMFPFSYETQNPITKFKGEIKYLYGVLKSGTNASDTKIIKELLSLKDSYAQRKSMIMKIKRKNLKRKETLDLSQEYYETEMKDMKKKGSTSSDTSNEKQTD